MCTFHLTAPTLWLIRACTYLLNLNVIKSEIGWVLDNSWILASNSLAFILLTRHCCVLISGSPPLPHSCLHFRSIERLTAADTSLQLLIPMLGSSMRMLLLLPTVILVVAEGIIRGVHLANSTLSAFRCAPLILLLAQAGKELTHLVSITRFECYSASLSQETTNNLSCQAGCESQFHSIFYHTRDQGAFLKFLQ